MRLAPCLTLALGLGLSTAPGAGDEPVAILQGDDPAQFLLVGIGADSIAIVDGEVRLTGKPLGYFATRREYRDYDLEFEWRYDRPDGLKSDAEFRGNSGLLLHLTGPPKVWPRCIQVQLAQSDPGAIFGVGDASIRGLVDTEAQKQAIRPFGQWNRVEVRCRGGAITCVLNGTEVARGEGASPDRGAIGWQSEGKPVRFRAIKIRARP